MTMDATPDTGEFLFDPPGADTAAAHFAEELAAVTWLLQEVREGRGLQVVEAEAVTHSLAGALRAAEPTTLPQLPLRRMSEYNAVHAINVALLAMALAEASELDSAAVRELGLAGLLHDLGMTFVPIALLSKAGQLEASEREQMRRHPVEGARIIVAADAALDVAAVVAYEHHLRSDGTGYPTLCYQRAPHYASSLVHLCDVYHALRSPRPFRQPWPTDITFSFISGRSGLEFDPELAGRLMTMVTQRGGA